RWLNITSRVGLFYIGVGTSPPVFVTPMLCSLLGVIQIIHPRLNESLYAELHRHVGGLRRCSDCGYDVCLSAVPFPRCAARSFRPGRSRGWLRFLVACALALLLASYVGAYYHLSRLGHAEADRYNMKGFYYFFPENTDVWRSKNYGCVYLFCPVNVVDR